MFSLLNFIAIIQLSKQSTAEGGSIPKSTVDGEAPFTSMWRMLCNYLFPQPSETQARMVELGTANMGFMSYFLPFAMAAGVFLFCFCLYLGIRKSRKQNYTLKWFSLFVFFTNIFVSIYHEYMFVPGYFGVFNGFQTVQILLVLISILYISNSAVRKFWYHISNFLVSLIMTSLLYYLLGGVCDFFITRNSILSPIFYQLNPENGADVALSTMSYFTVVFIIMLLSTPISVKPRVTKLFIVNNGFHNPRNILDNGMERTRGLSGLQIQYPLNTPLVLNSSVRYPVRYPACYPVKIHF